MKIALAEEHAAVVRCYPVMAQLRPHLDETAYLAAVERQRREGFQLLYLEVDGTICAVAGFRLKEMLAYGKTLYVDDLITDAAQRSKGYGALLLDWLAEYARAHECVKLHLDSGVQRFDAHRFYFTQRMWISAYHFSLKLDPQ